MDATVGTVDAAIAAPRIADGPDCPARVGAVLEAAVYLGPGPVVEDVAGQHRVRPRALIKRVRTLPLRIVEVPQPCFSPWTFEQYALSEPAFTLVCVFTSWRPSRGTSPAPLPSPRSWSS